MMARGRKARSDSPTGDSRKTKMFGIASAVDQVPIRMGTRPHTCTEAHLFPPRWFKRRADPWPAPALSRRPLSPSDPRRARAARPWDDRLRRRGARRARGRLCGAGSTGRLARRRRAPPETTSSWHNSAPSSPTPIQRHKAWPRLPFEKKFHVPYPYWTPRRAETRTSIDHS